MRVENSLKNIYISLLSQIVIVLLGFLSRKVFLDNLGADYLGVNGLLTNILSMLSLVEGGIGTSIVYNLYKPLAKNDKEKVSALVQLYKKLYFYIACGVSIISICLYPITRSITKNSSNIKFIWIIYSLFVIKNIISYFNAHKWSLITADQKGYVIAKYNLFFTIITTVCKIIVLKITQNYILYLMIELIIFIIQNIWNGKIVNEMYPYIKIKKKYNIDKETTENIKTNVKALFLHNIGSFCVLGTDNLLIGRFIGVISVGLYSNYNMIISQVHNLISPILNGIGASVGNLLAIEEKEKSYFVFNTVYLVNFWMYSVATIFLFNLLEPFINWWLGSGLLLDRLTFIVLLINFYLTGLRSCVLTFKNKSGIFKEDKYMTLVVAFINLTASIILVQYMGIAGVFIGTTISTISIPLWNQPKLLYNIVFQKSIWIYLKKYLLYVLVTLFAGTITTYLCNKIDLDLIFLSLVIKGIISIVIPSIIYTVIFFKTDEFKYLFKLLKTNIDDKIIKKLNMEKIN